MNARKWLLLAASASAFVACGARTGFIVPPPDAAPADAEPDVRDASEEPDATIDVAAEPDVFEEPDATVDAGEEDALPPIDVIQIDAPNPCPDAGSTLIYVITESNLLQSFYPPTATFTTIGTIACLDPGGMMPFSMAVDRKGIAYVLFGDGNLFRVSTADASCAATAFVSGTNGFPTLFGMGFAADNNDAGTETLYVAGDPGMIGNGDDAILASIDTTTFALTTIGSFTPTISAPELTGTGAGQLFGFFSTDNMASSAIAQIDKSNARVTGVSPLPNVVQGSGWAFGFWGGDFYTFTAPNGTTVVTRFSPGDGSIVQVASTDQLIVGAGVSTCAPQR
jgi:hypothetical protein